MGGRTVNCGKAGVRFIEDEVEVSARQKDHFDAITPAKSMRYVPQPRFIVG